MLIRTLLLYARSKCVPKLACGAQSAKIVQNTDKENGHDANCTCGCNRITPGKCVETSYFTGVGSLRWSRFFHKSYYCQNKPTAPLYLCPFCKPFEHYSNDNKALWSSRFEYNTEQMKEYTLLESLRWEQPSLQTSKQTKFVPSQQRRSQLCSNSIKFYTPYEIMTHMSFCHANAGFAAEQLHSYNSYMMQKLKERLFYTEHEHISSARRKSRRAPYKMIFFIDVANLEINGSELILDILRSNEAVEFFRTIPVALCAVHELSVPQTAKVTHAAFQLSQLHSCSDMFTLYSVSRAESGDALTCALLSDLHFSSSHVQHGLWECEHWHNKREFDAHRELPPCVVMTIDGQLKSCLLEMFGSAQLNAAPFGAIHTPRLSNTIVFVQMLWRALQTSWDAVESEHLQK